MTTETNAPPVVATYGSTDAMAPLVVLLHGRGSNEVPAAQVAAARLSALLVQHLPAGTAYTDFLVPVRRRLATPAPARINQWGNNLTLVSLAVHGHAALSMQPSRVTPGG